MQIGEDRALAHRQLVVIHVESASRGPQRGSAAGAEDSQGRHRSRTSQFMQETA